MYLDFGLEPGHLRPQGGVLLAQQVELPSQLQVLGDSDEVLLVVVLVLLPQCLSHFLDALLLNLLLSRRRRCMYVVLVFKNFSERMKIMLVARFGG